MNRAHPGEPAPEPLPGSDPLPGSEPLPGGEPLPGAAQRRVLCRVCGRPLRDPAARLWGLGEGCREKLALRSAPRPPGVEIEQETLPGV